MQQSNLGGTLLSLFILLIFTVVGIMLCQDWNQLSESYRKLVELRIGLLKSIEYRPAFMAAGYVAGYLNWMCSVTMAYA